MATPRSLSQHKAVQIALAACCFLAPLLFLPASLAEGRAEVWQRTALLGQTVSHVAVGAPPASIVYVSTAGGGLRRSLDSGATWEQANQGLPQTALGAVSVQAIATDATNPLMAWVGVDLPGGGGNIYRTMDGGLSWSLVSRGLGRARIHALAVASGEPGIVYAAADQHVFVSSDAGTTWVEEGSLPRQAPVRGFAIHPSNAASAYLSTDEGLLVTQDRGRTWQDISPDPADRQFRAVAIAQERPEYMLAATSSRLYSSSNGGRVWTPVSGLPPVRPIVTVVWDRRGTGIVFVVTEDSVIKGLDGLSSWREMRRGPGPAKMHGLAQASEGQLYLATSAGLRACTLTPAPRLAPATATTTAAPTPTLPATPTATLAPTPMPARQPPATATATLTPSAVPSSTATATPTASPTSTHTGTMTATATPSPTRATPSPALQPPATPTRVPPPPTPTAVPTVPPPTPTPRR